MANQRAWLRWGLVFVCTLAIGLVAQAQRYAEQGLPLHQRFTPRDYNAHAQNWAIAQGPTGYLYVANTGGLLLYDGLHWKQLDVGSTSVVRTVAVDVFGQVFVGGQGLLGVVVPDSAGFYTFRSLVGLLPEAVQASFSNVWHLFADGADVYVNTGYHLVRLRGDGAPPDVWQTVSGNDAFHTAFFVDGTLYVRQKGVGLQRLSNDKLTLVPGGEQFAPDPARIDAMMPYDDAGRVLLATQDYGCYLLTGRTLEAFPTAVDDLLSPYRLYGGTALGQGLFALSTARGGLLLINSKGEWVHHLRKSDGLPSDIVRQAYLDRQGSLWLALDGGIAQLEYPSPVTVFGEANGLNGSLTSVARFADRLYVGSGLGLFRLVPATGDAPARFEPVGELKEQVWDLLPVGDELLVATTRGLYAVRANGELRPVLHTDPETEKLPNQVYDDIYYCLAADPTNPNRVYAGKNTVGLARLDRTGRSWRQSGTFPGLDSTWGTVRFIQHDPRDPSTLWYGDDVNGLYRLQFTPEGTAYSYFGLDEGLPYLEHNSVHAIGDSLYVATDDGVYHYLAAENRFAPAEVFGPQFTKGRAGADYLAPGPDGYAWLNYTLSGEFNAYRLALLQQVTKERYRVVPSAAQRLSGVLIRSSWQDSDGTTWLATELDGLVRYAPQFTKAIETGFATLVLSVVANDSTALYDGAFLPTDTSAIPTAPEELSFTQNAMRFTFSALAFDGMAGTRYRYRLEPFDRSWSQWTTETAKSYTNLPPGDYVFRVQALNVYGQPGIDGAYAFTLLPPWYLTWWALTLIAIGALGLVVAGAVGYNRYRTAQLEARNRELEATVQVRTAEVVAQKEEIEGKNAELSNAYEEIRAQNENLEAAYHIIEEKNRDITDSIQYASRIQRAFLPTNEEIRKVFPNSFVMLMPRDIVSGDYYWFGRKGDYVLLAGADCTGHGVPGAFMSMMGNTLLHQIVSEGVVHPGEVLDILDQKVKFNLKQFDPNSKTNDGMEVMLWTVNLKTKELMYASASRPMVHIRGGVMTEIKAEKIPIGGAQYRDHRGFEAHAFPYESGDWVYTFSDGFPDQFGGDQGRKYMLKKTKQLLLDIHHLPAEEQSALVRKEMEDWMGENYEQTDDILVIGFQLP